MTSPRGRTVMTSAGSKMAAVCAELKFRDGLKERVVVNVGNNLTSVINGIHELNANSSRLLSELVEREKGRGVCAEGDEEEGNSDEEEGEPEDPKTSGRQPPAKRSKT